LTLIDPPMPDGTLIRSQYYQEYVDKICLIANDAGVEYWNFNLIKEDILMLERDEFKDASHLNGIGAEKFTRCFCRVYNGEVKEPFYNTYEDKIKNNSDNTYD